MNDEKKHDAAAPNPSPADDPAASASTPDAAAAPPGDAGTSAAPSQQEMGIRSALETVMDPEIGLSVIDLGLIRSIAVSPGRTHIEMLLTTPFCPYAPQMLADVKAAAMSVVEQETDVDILPDAWNPQMMPDPGLLGFSY